MTNYANNEKRVLVIGSATLDVVGKLQSFPEEGTSNPAKIRTTFGGVARNISENLARLGQSVTLITAVGEDQVGSQLIAQTTAAGVDMAPTLKVSGGRTSTYIALIDDDGGLHFAADDMRVLKELTPQVIKDRADLFKSASMVCVDANLTTETLETVFTQAHRAGVPVCADPATTSLAHRILPFLDRIHLITPNTSEAAVLIGESLALWDRQNGVNAARTLINRGVKTAVISQAEFGVCYANSETNGSVPAIRTAIVDPTGAGDAMTATVIFALLNDIPLDDAIRLGVSAASLTLRHLGTVVPDLTLEKLYSELVI